MGADIFFFTDVDLLNDQTAEQAFGPVSDTISQFRVVNTFTVLDKANIYAICRGKKLTYQDGTVILYPYDETIFDGLPVQYFIYTNVDVSNVVTQLIPEDESDDLLIAQQYKYSAYLESVEAGAIIAETYDNTVSIAVVTTGVDDGLRAFEKCVDCVTINGGENSKRQREKILSYMDISAFYGMFVGDKIKAKNNTGEVSVYKTKKNIYNDILSKFWNRNKIYVDIRDSRYYSLNYRKNEETQHCIEVQGNISSNVEYETFPQWPLLIIEEQPKDSNNADPLSLKYYEAIVQISNGRKTYCVFGYKRKGKRLKKQRLYNTSKISISFPVVNGNYVSSYYRYMVDTDVTNQEGLNGLFQVRPFEEYTRYYNSSAEVQSWLTGRLCFYENDVVACGIALDYGKDRIIFFAKKISKVYNNKNYKILINGSRKKSFYEEIFNPLVKKYKKYNVTINGKNAQVLCINGINENILTVTISKTEYDKINKKLVIYDYMFLNINHIMNSNGIDTFISVFGNEYEISLKGTLDDEIRNVDIKCYSYDEFFPLITTMESLIIEDIKEEKLYGGFYCEIKDRDKLRKSFISIKKHNPLFYNNINDLIKDGVKTNVYISESNNNEDITKNFKEKDYFPKIYIKIENFLEPYKDFSGLFSLSDENYEQSRFGARTNRIIRLKEDENDIPETVRQYLNLCEDCCEYNKETNQLFSKNVEWDFLDELNTSGKKWEPQVEIFNEFATSLNDPLWIQTDLQKAFASGRAVLKENLTIKLNSNIQDDISELSAILCHELGHLYARVNHMLEDYLWNELEDKISTYQEQIKADYPIYSKIKDKIHVKGHILGRPSGVEAVRQEYIYRNSKNVNPEYILNKNNISLTL